jgi:hypothetical protein
VTSYGKKYGKKNKEIKTMNKVFKKPKGITKVVVELIKQLRESPSPSFILVVVCSNLLAVVVT